MEENIRRFVGPCGEFVPSIPKEPGFVSINYLEEASEWIYFHEDLTDLDKLKRIKTLEFIIQDILNGGEGTEQGSWKPPSKMKIKYIPTWSTKLKKDMKIETVIRKNHEQLVRRMKVENLDINKLSAKFLSNKIDPKAEVFVKCDEFGNFEFRGKKQEYRIYPLSLENTNV